MAYELNADKTRAIMPINDFAGVCGYFFNAEFDPECKSRPNNGYNCKHPECEEVYNGVGCCFSWGCPFGWMADEEDCAGFGWDYEENEFIVVVDEQMLRRIIERENKYAVKNE